MRFVSLLGLMALTATSAMTWSAGLSLAQETGKATITMTPSLLADLSDAQQKFITDEFPVLVKDLTGLVGVLDKAPSPNDVADRLAAGSTQFGVLQGIEFAEVQAKYPDVKPLLVAIYRSPKIKAVLATKKESPETTFAELKGKDIAILKQGKEHVRRFVLKAAGGDPAAFFSKTVDAANSDIALDSVLLGKVHAAVVDDSSLEQYKEINPGRYNRLKIIAESEPFPPTVIAYNPKKADPELVKRFHDGMIKADQKASSREVMSTFRISTFEAIPPNFDELLAAIRKAYP